LGSCEVLALKNKIQIDTGKSKNYNFDIDKFKLPELLIENLYFQKFLSDSKSLNILDLGCASNTSLTVIKQFYKHHKLLGVDKTRNKPDYNTYEVIKLLYFKNEVNVYDEKTYNDFLKNSLLLNTDCLKFLNNDDDTYDFIIANNLFHLLSNEKFKMTVKLIRKKLVKDGKFFFSVKPNFRINNDVDKTNNYLEILEANFPIYKVFVFKCNEYPTSRIIFQNVI